MAEFLFFDGHIAKTYEYISFFTQANITVSLSKRNFIFQRTTRNVRIKVLRIRNY